MEFTFFHKADSIHLWLSWRGIGRVTIMATFGDLSMKTRRIVLNLFVITMFAAISACGQKGPLRLPNPGNTTSQIYTNGPTDAPLKGIP
ncbi:MAG: lipoprotein [Pseudomonadota bacterium]